MPIDQILKQNWDPNLKGKRTSSSAPPPQTQQQQLSDSKTLPLVPEHIGDGEIRDCLGLDVLPQRYPSRYFSSLSFLYLISAVLWEWEQGSLYFSLELKNEILFVFGIE